MTVSISIQYAVRSSPRISSRLAAWASDRIPLATLLVVAMPLPLRCRFTLRAPL